MLLGSIKKCSSDFCAGKSLGDHGGTSLRHGVVLLTRSAADPDCAYDLVAHPDGYAARKDHDATVIRYMNAEELAAGLRMLREVLGCNAAFPTIASFRDRSRPWAASKR